MCDVASACLSDMLLGIEVGCVWWEADCFGIAVVGYPFLDFAALVPPGVIPEDDQFLRGIQ